jgi:hypothetical protein
MRKRFRLKALFNDAADDLRSRVITIYGILLAFNLGHVFGRESRFIATLCS